MTETIYGQILAKANHYQAVPDQSTGGRRIILDEAFRRYAQSFYSQCKMYRDKYIRGAFRLMVDVYHSNMRFDLDNSLKTLLDLLQDVHAIEDDNRCVTIIANKHIDRNNPRVTFSIEPLEPTLF